MNQRIYIDANSGIGRMNFREERTPYKIETLADEMKYYRVHASLVYSNVSRDYSFIKGNEELIELIGGNNRLYGVATVIPHLKFELEEGPEYLEELLKKGIKAFKLYPRLFGHGFDPFSIEQLSCYMIKHDIPLLADSQEVDWKDLRETLEAFPELNIILCNTSWATNRFLFPLMEKFQNLFFDISSNQANDILKTCKKHFGVDRILFGTDYPNKVMGGLKALVEYSGLTEDDKNKISYKNAARLLKIDGLEIYKEDELMLDEIGAKVDSGLPLDNVQVIDSHTHLVDKRHFTVSCVPMVNGNEDCLIKKMDLLGIDKMFISPWEGLMTSGSSANETSIRAKGRYNDRIEAYAMCNPNYEEDLGTVVDIYHEKYKFKGLKPYFCENRYDLLGDKYKKWFEYGDANGLIMLVHASLAGIAEKVDELSQRYKNMTFLLAHSGASYSIAGNNIKVAKKRENVYLEITYTSLANGIIEYMVEEAGADKVIFGTDMPMRDPAPQLAWVCYARIPVEDKKKILGQNIQKLIERCYQQSV